jgi:HEAT repeat protein
MSEAITKLVNSPDKSDRIKVLNLIRELDPAIGFDFIKQLSADPNARVRYGAVSQMATLGKQDLDTSLTILRDRLINDPEPDVQAAAADTIGALKLTAAFEDLEDLYHTTPEWLVQFSIVAALGELGEPRGLGLLQTALTSDTTLVQTAAIGAIGELGNQAGVESLIPFITHDDWQVRYQTARALRTLGGDSAQAYLAILIQDDIPQVAQEARGD